MRLCMRMTTIAAAAAATLAGLSGYALAGDDGAAPLWQGIGSIFTPMIGLNRDDKPAIDYHERGKLVLPRNTDLPPPGSAQVQSGGNWPVDQESMRKRVAKEEEKRQKALDQEGDVRLRNLHPFPNAPVTVQAADGHGSSGGSNAEAPSALGSLNPMGWFGMGRKVQLGPEPDREWLTDPPKGYRAPAGTVGQAGQ